MSYPDRLTQLLVFWLILGMRPVFLQAAFNAESGCPEAPPGQRWQVRGLSSRVSSIMLRCEIQGNSRPPVTNALPNCWISFFKDSACSNRAVVQLPRTSEGNLTQLVPNAIMQEERTANAASLADDNRSVYVQSTTSTLAISSSIPTTTHPSSSLFLRGVATELPNLTSTSVYYQSEQTYTTTRSTSPQDVTNTPEIRMTTQTQYVPQEFSNTTTMQTLSESTSSSVPSISQNPYTRQHFALLRAAECGWWNTSAQNAEMPLPTASPAEFGCIVLSLPIQWVEDSKSRKALAEEVSLWHSSDGHSWTRAHSFAPRWSNDPMKSHGFTGRHLILMRGYVLHASWGLWLGIFVTAYVLSMGIYAGFSNWGDCQQRYEMRIQSLVSLELFATLLFAVTHIFTDLGFLIATCTIPFIPIQAFVLFLARGKQKIVSGGDGGSAFCLLYDKTCGYVTYKFTTTADARVRWDQFYDLVLGADGIPHISRQSNNLEKCWGFFGKHFLLKGDINPLVICQSQADCCLKVYRVSIVIVPFILSSAIYAVGTVLFMLGIFLIRLVDDLFLIMECWNPHVRRLCREPSPVAQVPSEPCRLPCWEMAAQSIFTTFAILIGRIKFSVRCDSAAGCFIWLLALMFQCFIVLVFGILTCLVAVLSFMLEALRFVALCQRRTPDDVEDEYVLRTLLNRSPLPSRFQGLKQEDIMTWDAITMDARLEAFAYMFPIEGSIWHHYARPCLSQSALRRLRRGDHKLAKRAIQTAFAKYCTLFGLEYLPGESVVKEHDDFGVRMAMCWSGEQQCGRDHLQLTSRVIRSLWVVGLFAEAKALHALLVRLHSDGIPCKDCLTEYDEIVRKMPDIPASKKSGPGPTAKQACMATFFSLFRLIYAVSLKPAEEDSLGEVLTGLVGEHRKVVVGSWAFVSAVKRKEIFQHCFHAQALCAMASLIVLVLDYMRQPGIQPTADEAVMWVAFSIQTFVILTALADAGQNLPAHQKIPTYLFITSPNRHQSCQGKYQLAGFIRRHPCWKKVNGTGFLFTDVHQTWAITDETGRLVIWQNVSPHCGRMPHQDHDLQHWVYQSDEDVICDRDIRVMLSDVPPDPEKPDPVQPFQALAVPAPEAAPSPEAAPIPEVVPAGTEQTLRLLDESGNGPAMRNNSFQDLPTILRWSCAEKGDTSAPVVQGRTSRGMLHTDLASAMKQGGRSSMEIEGIMSTVEKETVNTKQRSRRSSNQSSQKYSCSEESSMRREETVSDRQLAVPSGESPQTIGKTRMQIVKDVNCKGRSSLTDIAARGKKALVKRQHKKNQSSNSLFATGKTPADTE